MNKFKAKSRRLLVAFNQKQRLFCFGGDKGSRTPDLLNAIQALSQLSYTPGRYVVVDLCGLVKHSELNPNPAIVVWGLAYRCTPPIFGGGNLPLVEARGVEPLSENLLI